MIATAELGVAELEGGFQDAFDDARAVLGLAKRGADPIAHTGLLSAYSSTLVMSGRYEEGLKGSKALASVAESAGLEFAVPYAQCNSASAYIGLRRFAAASRMLSALGRYTQDGPGNYFQGSLPIQRSRLYASVGDVSRARDVLSLGPSESLNLALRGEFIGWQALFAAIAGDAQEAKVLADDACRVSRHLGTTALAHIADAIVALNDEQHEAVVGRLRTAVDTAMWDPIVISVRAAPRLGAFIVEQGRWRSWLQQLLAASRDTSLAASLGLQIPRAAKAKASLSPRESEVHELLAQGLTNEEIAQLLFISLSTTKVHVKHIYAKLGVRSRLEAARALRDDV
jgi:DNA-binding NarL/FixJ family response regulator